MAGRRGRNESPWLTRLPSFGHHGQRARSFVSPQTCTRQLRGSTHGDQRELPAASRKRYKLGVAIEYRRGSDLDTSEVIALLRASTLGERRPIDEPERITLMIRNATLIFTAWDGARLVGIARSLSDFTFCTYLSDLAVDLSYQRRGIGKELMRLTQEAGAPATLLLFAAPAAVGYYPHVGFEQGSGWMLRPDKSIL